MEYKCAKDSGSVLVSKAAGEVSYVSADFIKIKQDDGEENTYQTLKFLRSNQGMCYNQRPIVQLGERIEKDEIIADGPSTSQGELSLGRNVLAAYTH